MKLSGSLKKIPSSVIISRTDSVGDVVLALPMAAALKKKFPDMKIAMMGRIYTKPVIDSSVYIDAFINVDDFMKNEPRINNKSFDCIIQVLDVAEETKRSKKLKIPIRIGIANRLYHWLNSNVLVFLSRSRSLLNEAQLDMQMLQPFGIKKNFSLTELSRLYGMQNLVPLSSKFLSLLDAKKCNIILHPKSRGNGREWSAENFISLINSLDTSLYRIFISGVESEKKTCRLFLTVLEIK